MSHSGLDDYVAQGLCTLCYTKLDYKEGCPDCDEKCQECGEYMFTFENKLHKIVDEETMCPDCWSKNRRGIK